MCRKPKLQVIIYENFFRVKLVGFFQGKSVSNFGNLLFCNLSTDVVSVCKTKNHQARISRLQK